MHAGCHENVWVNLVDAVQEETELSQPTLDKELWKKLLSAAN